MHELEEIIEAVSWKPSFEDHYKEYYRKIKYANHITLGAICELLNPTNNTICTVGSDARLEKGYASKIELTVLLNDNYENCSNLELTKEFDSVFHPLLEFKGPKEKSYLYLNDESRIFPTRALDLRFIMGDYNRFVQEKAKFIKEIGEDYAKIKKAIKQRRSYYLKILTEGSAKFKNMVIRHYDLESGEVFYDNKTRWGLKYGPLRAVQYDAAYNAIKFLRKNQDVKFLLQMPTNIVDRLWYLEGKPYLPSEIDEIADNYMFFIKEYHICQKDFKRTRRGSQEDALLILLYNQNQILEIKERINSLNSLLKR